MKFVFGIALGALGMWAYRSGKLQGIMGGSAAEAWQPAVEKINQVVNPEHVASAVQDRVQQMRTPEIATPTPAEVAGRPSEPLPNREA